MPAVGGPQLPVRTADDDQRIQERAALLDLRRQTLRVGGGQVALEWRRFHGLDGQRGEQHRLPAERLAVGGSPERFQSVNNIDKAQWPGVSAID